MADFIIKQGDTEPVFEEQFLYENGEAVNLEGATVTFTMRSLTATAPVALTGKVQITNASHGKLYYAPSATDTAAPGSYMASWRVEFGGGEAQTFPTVGYLWVEVQENLTVSGSNTLLVALPEVKSYLNIEAHDRIHDAKLIRYIEAVRPLIENITGPILPRVFEEWHMGGNYFISLRRRPSTGYGTSQVLTLMACSEYRGPIEYPLSIIQNPAEGTIYSCMLQPREGVVERRTSGGGVMAFPAMANSVHVVYQAGQAVVPANVVEGALEAIRVNWQTTQNVGRGQVAQADELEGPYLGFFLPRRVHDLLSPTKRAPSIC